VKPLEMCCGGTCVRAVCPYHGPSQPATTAAPAARSKIRRELTPDGHYVRTYRDDVLIDEEPVEAYVGLNGLLELESD
jgi:hypothetical protein